MSGARPSGQALAVPATPLRVDGPSGFDPSRIGDAIIMAVGAHEGQLDKAGAPYILHPLRLLARLESRVLQVVAVLHDVVEDSFVSLSDIEGAFGSEVADAVDALTRRKGESYFDFIDRCGTNQIARAVKLVDLQDNMDLFRLPNVTEADLARNEKYRKAMNRLSASAIEARRAETHSGSVHESAVGNAETPNPVPISRTPKGGEA